MSRTLQGIKIICLLPVAILFWALYLLPLILTKQICYSHKSASLVWFFLLSSKNTPYTRLWVNWSGFSGPFFIIAKYKSKMIEDHEKKHCEQQLKWGFMFYPIYIGFSFYIFLKNYTASVKRHPYLDNFFEKEARKAAGQKVNFTREEWPSGPNDYNPWW